MRGLLFTVIISSRALSVKGETALLLCTLTVTAAGGGGGSPGGGAKPCLPLRGNAVNLRGFVFTVVYCFS